MIKYTEATDIGLVRTMNEDSVLCLPPTVFVVADGMGGHLAGEVASHIFTATVKNMLANDISIDSPHDLNQIFSAGNKAILASQESHPERSGMGTTATMAYIQGSQVLWGHVGDSRLYHMHNGEMEQITTDHSYVNHLLAQGSITQIEAEHHPQRNMLMRAVGVDQEVTTDTGLVDLVTGDSILLCSDGLTNMVTKEVIATIMSAQDCPNKAQALVDCAKAGGGTDNISVIVVDYYEE